MPRSKIKAKGRKCRATDSSFQGSISSAGVEDLPVHTNATEATGRNHLTLQEEARNTEGRNSRRTNVSLRYQAVLFVSAGSIQPDEDPNTRSPELPDETQGLQAKKPCEAATTPSSSLEIQHCRSHTGSSDEDVATTAKSAMTDCDPCLLNPEDSSEDEVVFPGRQNQSNQWYTLENGGSSHTAPTSADTDRPIKETRTNCLLDVRLGKRSSIQLGMVAGGLPVEQGLGDCSDYIDIRSNRAESKKKTTKHYISEEEAILADYIANMDDEYVMLHDRQTKMTSREVDCIIQTRDFSPSSIRSAGLADEEKVSHDEIVRQRSSQEGIDIAECMQNSSTIGDTNGLDREGVQLITTPIDTAAENADERTERAVPSDASSDLGTTDSREWETGDYHSHTERRLNEEESLIASATAFADALDLDPYYGFDIMDFNRPSLKKKAKGKGHAFDAAVFESDLEAELLSAWQTDRAKKRLRKQQREKLRSEGLLGRRSGEPDLRVKYAKGMDMVELKTEIRLFLLSTKKSLVLPPMAKQQRKLVHELANSMDLNSKSRGKGSSRFPILNKTSRTPGFTQQNIPQLDRMLSKGGFVQRDFRSGGHQAIRSAKSRRGRPDASASYMDGEVVGASAPEIGAGNRGRAMLEKMGWSIGTPLGASNNKGILQPVVHVVKNSRTGLG
ncbi:putative R3H and G-patch domain protein [Aspergillus saccharolyticus JOP 1030-1]|uniref:Protein SQS1 n=1 Tax=Aspergillus saccharolyticus JOP 1030-1 TaxID=1450539 RepID=A0A318ZLM9_9EURO|nr:hypothetical protein BP01DRAFT_408342 [Aspergillus saccharolyticus JOP 1030-1]PYH41158.1 hypothetical protein BP01DRAFT_408342 [Aspergillus saccharolyticus JOP 1030-1]